MKNMSAQLVGIYLIVGVCSFAPEFIPVISGSNGLFSKVSCLLSSSVDVLVAQIDGREMNRPRANFQFLLAKLRNKREMYEVETAF